MKPFKSSSPAVQVMAQDLGKLHLATQAARFVRLAAFFFIAHIALPADWDWQAVAALAAASAEAAFQQMAPQLPVAQLVNTLLSSPELHKWLAGLTHLGSSGQPQTVVPGPAASTPMTAPPAAGPAAGTTQMTTGTDPATDPAQRPQAVPNPGEQPPLPNS